MIKVLQNIDKKNNEHLFEQMFRLRALEFHERRKWQVVVEDGKEMDYFDDLDPIYVMVVNSDEEVLASLRLLPTTGPYMLSDIFHELMAGESIIRNPLVWESSRFCVDHTKCSNQQVGGVGLVTKKLLKGAFETAQSAGIESIISVADLLVVRILKKCGCDITQIGEPYVYGTVKTIAGFTKVSDETIKSICNGLDDIKVPQVVE